MLSSTARYPATLKTIICASRRGCDVVTHFAYASVTAWLLKTKVVVHVDCSKGGWAGSIFGPDGLGVEKNPCPCQDLNLAFLGRTALSLFAKLT